MEIIVNGEPQVLPSQTSVAGLLGILGVQGRLAVEINAEIVPKSRHAEHYLNIGDRVEIVKAIGGG